MTIFINHGNFDALGDIRRPSETPGNEDLDGLLGGQGIRLERSGGIHGQKTLDFSGFIPGPQQGGHATGGRGFGLICKPVYSPKYADPLAVFHVVKVDAVGITGFDGLRGGKAPMLLCGQFPQFSCQFF